MQVVAKTWSFLLVEEDTPSTVRVTWSQTVGAAAVLLAALHWKSGHLTHSLKNTLLSGQTVRFIISSTLNNITALLQRSTLFFVFITASSQFVSIERARIHKHVHMEKNSILRRKTTRELKQKKKKWTQHLWGDTFIHEKYKMSPDSRFSLQRKRRQINMNLHFQSCHWLTQLWAITG